MLYPLNSGKIVEQERDPEAAEQLGIYHAHFLRERFRALFDHEGRTKTAAREVNTHRRGQL
jgi:hypothetical protein